MERHSTRMLPETHSWIDSINWRGLTKTQIAEAAAILTDQQVEQLLHHWPTWARPAQLAPAGDWDTWLICAGRGAGKTRAGAEWVRQRVKDGCRYIGLIGATAADTRDVMVEGESGLLAVCWDKDVDHTGQRIGRPLYEPSKRRITWENGARATTFSADEPDRLRGPQHDTIWCFTAGTMVATPSGNRAIETLVPGDDVLTRRGVRRVVANAIRTAVVGQVTFCNGSILVGTPDHPVYRPCGWTRLSDLKVGDMACAINASSGMGSGGTGMGLDVAPTTSERSKLTDQRKQFGFIERCGSIISGLFQMGSRSITGMTTNAIMRLTTWIVSKKESTRAFTGKSIRYQRQTGGAYQTESSDVLVADAISKEKRFLQRQGVQGATKKELTNKESPLENAYNAVMNSPVELETTVASVASTWQRQGEQRVFCLKVEGEPEYFANGILVHNCDEIAAWRYPETWDLAMMGLRLGAHPQALATTTPKPVRLVRQLMADPGCIVTRGATADNRANLARTFLAAVERRYGGTRLGRQELLGELLEDTPGALWSRDNIDANRLQRAGHPDLTRIVVAIDPAITSGEDADETGIVAVGKDRADHGYVLEDATMRGSPDAWARAAVRLHDRVQADCLVAEANQGGEMVALTIRTAAQALHREGQRRSKQVAVRMVHTFRGKALRAEPVSALYEQSRVHHCGAFPALEDQMCEFTSDFDRTAMGYSPDRVDALVHGLTEVLLLGQSIPMVGPAGNQQTNHWGAA